MSSPLILDGKKISQQIRQHVSDELHGHLLKQAKFKPILATIVVGNDPASITYVNMKAKTCESVGMSSEIYALKENTPQKELNDLIIALNNRPEVRGILLQHPIPANLNETEAFNLIDPTKDVDGVTHLGFARMTFGQKAYGCATPMGIMKLLTAYDIPLAGKNAIVIGRSAILGKPMSMMLLNANATVMMAHSKSQNLPDLVRWADIVIAGVGKPQFVQGDWLKPGAVVVDAGYNYGNKGDCHYESCVLKASAITPVPGGVGPMTIATLISQTLDSFKEYLSKI